MSSLIQGWLPPTRENWEFLVWGFQFFPLIAIIQLFSDYYPQGKTSISSRFNIPGRIAWSLMEVPGATLLVYCFIMIPRTYEPPTSTPISDRFGPDGTPALTHITSCRYLPWNNWIMAGMFVVHYIYRAILAPLYLNPSMAPIHPFVFLSAASWQVVNGPSIGGWISGYGPTTNEDWSTRTPFVVLGMITWTFGFLGNIYHDDELREIRRQGAKGKGKSRDKGKNVVVQGGRVYQIPENALFKLVLYPHYLCEFIEWTGLWIMGGWGFTPARSFVINEMATMIPSALRGWRWYVRTFGRERVGNRKAVIPFLI